MLLRMKTTAAGPEYTVQAGELYECADDNLARQLIKDGNAEEYEAVEGAEMVSTFHGGLKSADRTIHELNTDVAPVASSSTAREQAEVTFPIERRTADELARDAKAAAGDVPTAQTGPLPAKSSNRRAAEEIQAKVGDVQSRTKDTPGSAHEQLVSSKHQSAPQPGTSPTPKATPTPTPTAAPKPAPTPAPADAKS